MICKLMVDIGEGHELYGERNWESIPHRGDYVEVSGVLSGAYKVSRVTYTLPERREDVVIYLDKQE